MKFSDSTNVCHFLSLFSDKRLHIDCRIPNTPSDLESIADLFFVVGLIDSVVDECIGRNEHVR